MLHAFPYIALLAQLAVVSTMHPVGAPSAVPFDTTLSARSFRSSLRSVGARRMDAQGRPTRILHRVLPPLPPPHPARPPRTRSRELGLQLRSR